MTVFVQRPDAYLNYTFQWADDVPEGISLVAVTYTCDLTQVNSTIDIEEQTSTVMFAGAVHGYTYPVSALAQLSNGEYIPGETVLRGFNQG